ncbi:MAG: GNAT family N-acetyltransferase [Acidimicrobiia bacterium]|nr:GNAT family N-acetyltransferase [Acidimicrobiia bacterium]
MPKRRLGVALLLPAPFDREVDALRRACDDGALGRIPSHLTLVPPVNVREDAMGDALRVLRSAAASIGSFTLQLGPPATFQPDSPTLYLVVSGPDIQTLGRLRDGVFVPPLERPLTWPFVPHVTLADEMAPDRIEAAVGALAGYRATVTFERVHLLEESKTDSGRVWCPIADAPFASPAIVGRGGIELELSVSEGGDDEIAAFEDREWDTYRVDTLGPHADGEDPFTIAARRDGEIVGAASGYSQGGVAYLRRLMIGRNERGLGIGSQLLAAFESLAAERGCRHLGLRTYADSRAFAFYLGHGWREVARWTWKNEREMVQMRRDL